MQDPEIYLDVLGVTLRGHLDGERPAVLDPTHRSRIGHETFFFADLDAKRAFDADPLRWCGRLTDPVSGKRFRPDAASWATEYNGRRYYFSSQRTWQRFLRRPDAFADAKRKMPKMKQKP